jgi:hypothetical protein
MIGLRSGKTLRNFSVRPAALEAYFEAHPSYAQEARPLIEANAKAANLRRGDHFRNLTHFKQGHPSSEARVRVYKGSTIRDCVRCESIRRSRGAIIKPEALVKVIAAFESGGATVNQIIHGRPIGGGPTDRSLIMLDPADFYRCRRENPEFDQFIATKIADNRGRGQRIRRARLRTRVQTAARREEANDYHSLLAMLPPSFPDKDDIVSAIFEDILTGKLKREDVKERVRTYIAAHNRMYPTKFAKFGNSPLVSLDEVMFEDGSTTRGDTVSRGLWD